MIIGIDANPLTRPFQHGIRRYLEALLDNIAKLDKTNLYVIFASKKVSIPNNKNFKLVIIPKFPILKRQLFLPVMALKNKIDVFHNIDSYGPAMLDIPAMVTTVHDMKLGKVYPTFSSIKYFTKRYYSEILRYFTFKNTDHFISVSKSASNDLNTIIRKLNLTRHNKLIYEAPSDGFRHVGLVRNKRKYFLCMVDFSPRKNFETTVRSFILFQSKTSIKYNLYVIVSSLEELKNINKITEKFHLEESVRFFVSPSDQKVSNLYRFATGLIYISLYEGFGLPILEAMSVGCPVITSNLGATKEVAGNAAILVNPRSVQLVSRAMLKLTKFKSFRENIIKKGTKRASEFNLVDMAKRTIEVYKAAYDIKRIETDKNKKRLLSVVVTLALLVISTITILIFRNDAYSWSTFVSDGKVSTSVIKKGKTLIFGTANSKLFFLKNNNTSKSFDLNTGFTNWIGLQGNNVLVMSDDTIRSIRIRDQKLNWKQSTSDQTLYVKAQVINNLLVTGSANGAINVYRATDGKLMWEFATKPLTNLSSISAVNNLHYFGNFYVDKKVIYLASQDHNLYALNLKNGHLLWRYDVGEMITSGPSVYKQSVYIGTISGKSIGISADKGEVLWNNQSGQSVVCTMPITGTFGINKSSLLELHSDGILTARDLNSGENTWETKSFGPSSQCPTLWKSNVVVVTTNGDLNLVSLRSGKVLYKRSGLGEILASPILKPRFAKFIPSWLNIFSPEIFIENSSGDLFKINVLTGKDIWKFSVGAPSVNILSLIENNIIFPTTNGVTYRVNSRTGTPDISLKEKGFSVVGQTSKVSDINIFELTLKSDATFTNPWAETDIYAIFSNEDGAQIMMPGFYYDQGVWKVRFNPPTKGKWYWKVFWSPHGKTLTKSGEFVSETDTTDFYLKVSEVNFTRLTVDGKNIFNGIGLGDSLDDYNSNGTSYDDYTLGNSNPVIRTDSSELGRSDTINTLDDYIATYGPKGAGFNIFRWSLMNASQSQYTNLNTPSTYSILQGKIGDQLVEKLRNGDMHIWLTMFGFDIPYKYDNSQGSVYVLQSYVKYLFARYGAYVDVWELANELSVPYGASNTLTSELKSLDFEHRLVSISSSDYNFKDSEIIAPHWYETEPISQSDIKTVDKIEKYIGFNKPVVFAEQGNLFINYDETSAIRMRIRAWTSLFNSGTLIFWNQSDRKDFKSGIFPGNLYIGEVERSYIKVLQELTTNFPLTSISGKYDLRNNGVRGYRLTSESLYAGYFYHYSSPFTETSFTQNIYTKYGGEVNWIDPATGNLLQSGFCEPGGCNLTSPTFKTDIVLLIKEK
jgi:glycosyltransferase involved in cell wall biosynthesis/outer membrane protein assembly factor BamB